MFYNVSSQKYEAVYISIQCNEYYLMHLFTIMLASDYLVSILMRGNRNLSEK